jgi:hypothetical protein
MTYQEYAKSLSNENLTIEMNGLQESIDCFGVRDLILLEALEPEADKRVALANR